MGHAAYNPAGGNTWRKRKRGNSGHSTKGKPGTPKMTIWQCPNPELHSAAPDAVLVGASGKVTK